VEVGLLGYAAIMHFRFWVCIGLGLQTCSLALAVPAATSKITEVVVYADRARVSRELTVSVPAGDSRFDLSGLPADLDDNSLGITIRSGSPVTIRGMDVQKEFLSENADARSLDLLKQLDQLQNQKRALQSQRSVLEDKREFFRKLNPSGDRNDKQVFSYDELKKVYDLYSGELTTIANGFRELDAADRKLNPEIERVQKELGQLNQKKEQHRVSVSVQAQSAAELRVELRYVVHNASWLPVYEARVDTSNAKVSLMYDAMIRQQTGEDWTEARLTVSTARPEQNNQMPELEPRYLRFSQPLPVSAPRSMAFKSDNALPSATPTAKSEAREEDTMADVESARLESNGLSVTYQVPASVTIPSDGQAHRTNLTQIELNGKLLYVTTPRLEPAAFLKEYLTNPGPDPLLPGKVNLFRDGDLIGNLTLPQVSTGAEFDLFCGRDDAVKVEHKELVNRDTEIGILSHRKQNQRKYQIAIQNFRRNPIKLTVYDQIPVSQDNDIGVTQGQYSSKPTSVDKDSGKITWDLDLSPSEKKTVEFDYTIEWPAGKAIEPE
jgi:uncharacterized protein (TIGR02231 family)